MKKEERREFGLEEEAKMSWWGLNRVQYERFRERINEIKDGF